MDENKFTKNVFIITRKENAGCKILIPGSGKKQVSIQGLTQLIGLLTSTIQATLICLFSSTTTNKKRKVECYGG